MADNDVLVVELPKSNGDYVFQPEKAGDADEEED